ncbi:unnamed protein product [Candida parapsilosis]
MKLYLGLTTRGYTQSFIPPKDLPEFIKKVNCDSNFDGISLWDASGAWLKDIVGDWLINKNARYIDEIKYVLENETCPSPSSSTTASSSTEPSSSEEPTSSAEPTSSEEPTSSAEPTSSEESTSSAEPTSSEEFN